MKTKKYLKIELYNFIDKSNKGRIKKQLILSHSPLSKILE